MQSCERWEENFQLNPLIPLNTHGLAPRDPRKGEWGSNDFIRKKLMMKIFSSKSGRSFVAVFPAEAVQGGSCSHIWGDLLMPAQASVGKAWLWRSLFRKTRARGSLCVVLHPCSAGGSVELPGSPWSSRPCCCPQPGTEGRREVRQELFAFLTPKPPQVLLPEPRMPCLGCRFAAELLGGLLQPLGEKN